MMKKHDLISVVLRCYYIPCIGQVTFKGGQEASLGYLLLGVYYIRIPGDTPLIFHYPLPLRQFLSDFNNLHATLTRDV
jgi:hypothetical protein